MTMKKRILTVLAVAALVSCPKAMAQVVTEQPVLTPTEQIEASSPCSPPPSR